MGSQYRRISNEEIAKAAEHDPMRAALMMVADATLADASKQAEGAPHEPTFHESGWSIAIETPQGVVGLWSCWLNNQFYLGYPKSAVIPDELVMEVLGVELAKPVANERFGTRQWTMFYGPQLPDGQGRVWIDHSNFNSNGHHFRVVHGGAVESVYYGHDESMSIGTEQFSFYNEVEPEAPNATPEAIQPYRDKFLELLVRVSEIMGGAEAINIDYGFVLVPEQLETVGYTDVTWLKGKAGTRKGWGEDIVIATKHTDRGEERLALESANSLVPWVNVRHVPWTVDLSTNDLLELLKF